MSNTENNARTFFGRQAERDQFQQRIAQPLDDQHPLSVWNIWGVDGVGKTELVGQLLNAARQQADVTGIKMDDQVPDVPTLLKWLTDDLIAKGWKFKEFLSAYKLWKASPESQGLLQRIPEVIGGGAGVLLNPAVGKLTEVSGKFLLSGWDKRNELIRQKIDRNPIALLTDHFTLALIEQCQTRKLVLAIDEYDAKRMWLEAWLLKWLNNIARTSKLGLTVILVSHKALTKTFNWANLTGLVSSPLQPFSRKETGTFCRKFGITDQPELVANLHRASSGLPLYLASQIGKPLTGIPDFSEESYNNFLSQVGDPETRWLMVQAASPRFFDLDVLTALLGEEKARRLFEPLTKMPFIRWEDQQDGTRAWVYHSSVRQQFLHFHKKASMREWSNQHSRLADYYESERTKKSRANPNEQLAYLKLTAEIIYHRLCQDPPKNLTNILNAIIEILLYGPYDSGVSKALNQAEDECNIAPQKRWGISLLGITVYPFDNIVEQQISYFEQLLNYPELRPDYKAPLYYVRSGFRLIAAFSVGISGHSKTMQDLINEAKSDINRAIVLSKPNANYYARKGDLHQIAKEYGMAITAYTQSIALDPNHASYYEQRAESFTAQGQWDEALADINQAIEIVPNATSYYLRGLLYENKQEKDAAINDYRHALTLSPQNIQIHLSLRSVYLKQHRWLDLIDTSTELLNSSNIAAMQKFLELMAIDQKFDLIGDIRKERGISYQMLERYKDASVDFSYLIEHGIADSQVYFGRAECFYQSNQLARALKDYKQAIKHDPDNDQLLFILGQRYLESNLPSKALRAFSEAIKRNPENQNVYLFRGITYQRIQRNDLAIADFSQVILLNPNQYEAYYHRGLSYIHTEEHTSAITDLELAIVKIPSYANSITFTMLATCYLMTGQKKKAQEYLHRSKNTGPLDNLNEED